MNLPHSLDWNTAVMFVLVLLPCWYLDMLDELQKRIYRTVGLSHVASLEPLAHCGNVASLSWFYEQHFGRCSLNWLNWLLFLYLRGVLLNMIIGFIIFLSLFLDVIRMSLSFKFLVHQCSIHGVNLSTQFMFKNF